MNLKKFKYISVDVLIGEKTTLTGDLVSESAIKIDGTILGNITSDKEVILSESAVVSGNICASALIIAGTLTGNVITKNQLLIKATGRLEGDVEAGALVIEEGGVFLGMNRSPQKPDPLPENPEAEDVNEIV